MPAITIADLNNAKQDVDHIAGIATSTLPTSTDRLGNSKQTMSGVLANVKNAAAAVMASMGYEPPVAYAAGLAMSRVTQTVQYSGDSYAPRLDSLPFTTSGTFETAKFRLIQGISGADLSASYGAGMLGCIQPGGIVRTVQDKLQEFASVRDYGAKGDGMADDTAAIDTAKASVGLNGTLRVPHGSYLYNGTVYNVQNDFQWINKAYAGSVDLLTSAQNAAMLVTAQTDATTGSAVDGTKSRIGYSATVTAYGNNHADGIRTNLFNHSTDGNGNTAIYAHAESDTMAYWSAALHGETRAGGGTNIGVNTESRSYTTTGGFYGAVISNTTGAALGTTHPLTGAAAVAHPLATGVLVQGTNNAGSLGGWQYGLKVDTNAMRDGGVTMLIGSTAAVTAHIQTTTGAAAASADILLQGNSANGVILNGTYSGSAIRINDGQSLSWEASGNVRTNYSTTNNVLGYYTSKTTERVGFVLNGSPAVRVGGVQVVGQRSTGWNPMTGTTDKATAMDTSTATLQQLAQRVAALQAALTAHGLLGA